MPVPKTKSKKVQSVRLHVGTYRRFISIKGYLTSKMGKNVSLDDTMNALIDSFAANEVGFKEAN
jgi:hypothetical protein